MTDEAQKSRRKRSAFVVLVIAILVMPWLGPGPLLAALVLAAALIGMQVIA